MSSRQNLESQHLRLIFITDTGIRIGLDKQKVLVVKPFEPIDRVRVFFKLAKANLDLIGRITQHYMDLAQCCLATKHLLLDFQNEEDVFAKLSKHDLFQRVMTGEPQQIKNIANLLPQFTSLEKLYKHLKKLKKDGVKLHVNGKT